MSTLRSKKPLTITIVCKDNKKRDLDLLTVKEAAQLSGTTVSYIEALITRVDATGIETKLDITYPSPHDGEKSGPKYIVCNEKWDNFIASRKK
jgi:hypothetical protein